MEKFNPSEYKKFEDLPKDKKEEFKPVEGGFVREEAAKFYSDTEKEARGHYKKYPPKTEEGEIREDWKKDGKKVTLECLHKKANVDESERQQEKRDKKFIEDCQNRDYILEQAKKGFGGTVLYDFVPSEFRSDEEIMYYALTRDRLDDLEQLWHHTSQKLCNKEFLKRVLEKNWYVLLYLNGSSLVDEDIMRAAFKSYRKEQINRDATFEEFKEHHTPRNAAQEAAWYNGMG